ncbi:MAG: hypothetical protein JWO24_4186 [Rhodospirillales bacterium]|nr:hypothetical protein [Rhodospirillales bacterium]
MTFPSENLVKFLRDHLWRRKPGRSAGQAAVMVGAGFSRNAEVATASARPFPTWNEITGTLSEALYPGGDPALTASGTSGALRLAQEFEAVFGRERLEEVIRTTVPDAENVPGHLHARLLALPWADVFTTNWDTLLERARQDVHERSYDLVLTPSQMPSASVPRIVKLHGSLPATAPFILTEEDYRTYPARFAPFVNLVQQSMMENAFVLLGFSGDDPNFLHWSGWVRDNLGVHAPKIYLVNWLALSAQRRRLLEDRNVVPIDLAELPQAAGWPEKVRHAQAVEWFLHAMEAGRPFRASAWPWSRNKDACKPPAHLGWLPAGAGPGTVEELHPRSSFMSPPAERVAELAEATTAWATNRMRYPGWLVAPKEVRDRVWQGTSLWLGSVSVLLEAMPPRERLLALGEVLWRLDLCLTPAEIVSGLPEVIASTLDLIDFDARALCIGDGAAEPMMAAEVEAATTALLSHARAARWSGRDGDFDLALDGLARLRPADREVSETIRYERILRSAQRLEHNRLEAELDRWDVEALDPVWGLRKAGLLAGAGRVRDAWFALRLALARVRRETRRDVDDHASLSREAWGMWLTLAWRSPWGEARDLRPDRVDAFERWRELIQHDGDAMAEYHSLRSEMLKPIPSGDTSKSKGFEGGQTSTVQHFRSGLPAAYHAALQMTRLAEATGLPPAANRVQMLQAGLAEAAGILADDRVLQSALLAMACSGSGSDKVLTGLFTRARVALLDPTNATQLALIAAASIDYATPRARPPEPRHDHWLTQMRVSLEVLSRLALRCSAQELEALLARAVYLYRLEWPAAHLWMFKELSNLFARVIESLPASAIKAVAPALLDLPVPGTHAFLPAGAGPQWRDPIAMVSGRARKISVASSNGLLSLSPGTVARLLTTGRESGIARPVVVTRLLFLRDLGALSPSEEQELAVMMWAEDDRPAGSLPTDLQLQPWYFLLCPEPESGTAELAFRQAFLTSRDSRKPLGDVLRNIGFALWQTRLRDRRLIMREPDIAAVLELIEEWSGRPVVPPTRFSQINLNDATSAITGLGLVLTEHAFPAGVLGGIWDRAKRLQELGISGEMPFSLYPGLARAFPERAEELQHGLRAGLVSAEPSIVSEALIGLYRWMDAAQDHRDIPEVASDLIMEIGSIVAARRPGAVARALEVARWIFDEGPIRARVLIAPACDRGLGYLLTEASYEAELRTSDEQDFHAALLRRNSVELALAMAACNESPAEGIRRWLEIAAEDPLPEVRNLILNRDNSRACQEEALQAPSAIASPKGPKPTSDGGAPAA